MTDARVTFALKVLMIVVLVFYLAGVVVSVLDRIHAVVYILIAAVFFAYLIYPAVSWLRRRMPLVAAIATVYAAILLVLLAVFWWIIPRLVQEGTMLAQHYPDLLHRIDASINDPANPITSGMPGWARTELAHIPAQLARWVQYNGLQAFSHIIVVLAGTFAAFATFIIVPMLAAYLLLDLENLERALAAIVPADRWRSTLSLLADLDHVIGGFIRGQMLVGLSVGVLITIALTILHVPYAFLLGLLAAIGDLIPYVGAIVAYFPTLLTALVNNGIVNAVIVTAAFVAIYEAEGHFIAPNIVSRTVRLSPFSVLLALLIGAELAGIVGALVAIPVAGALRVIALRVFHPPEANEPQP